jgi:hypothetical protein
MNQLQQEAMAYQRAQKVLESVNRNRLYLTPEEYKALRKRAVGGDVNGAEMQLAAILKARRQF